MLVLTRKAIVYRDVDRSSVLLRDIRVGSERLEDPSEKELSSRFGKKAD